MKAITSLTALVLEPRPRPGMARAQDRDGTPAWRTRGRWCGRRRRRVMPQQRPPPMPQPPNLQPTQPPKGPRPQPQAPMSCPTART